ncbi:hypothetical protein E2562_017633 [Oryza meyeriana var. granulata]|uniref:Uncharacterized protein n=1 Tax=Oryza meyeriana var. granulata TaxID=110450 RepID=A0A6G1BZ43_9ORYZ|nr:hypothetical protein E2562_017633 [Oryza meyeriana var. granulata]
MTSSSFVDWAIMIGLEKEAQGTPCQQPPQRNRNFCGSDHDDVGKGVDPPLPGTGAIATTALATGGRWRCGSKDDDDVGKVLIQRPLALSVSHATKTSTAMTTSTSAVACWLLAACNDDDDDGF